MKVVNSLRAFAAIGFTLLGACGINTPFKYEECRPLACTTGVDEGDDGTYEIWGRGNAVTDLRQVEEFALLKAAEFTLEQGSTHFMILSSQREDQLWTEYGTTYRTFSRIILKVELASADQLPNDEAERKRWMSAQEVYDQLAPRHITKPTIAS
jgi:hypothetical protein